MQLIRELINQAVKDLGVGVLEFSVEHPKNEKFGDYSTNVALQALRLMQTNNPLHGYDQVELARKILEQIYKDPSFVKTFEKVEVAGPGFINFYLSSEFLAEELNKATIEGYGKNKRLHGQKTFVEFTDPNPFKEFHIGHLMSNTIGEALARILEANGATVKRANYQGDVGLHVAKSIWGWQKKITEDGKNLGDLQGQALQERVAYLGQAYALGATEYEVNEQAKAEMNAMNKVIYDKSDRVIDELYQAGRKWSLEYFETIYQRLGTKFDEYFFESEAGAVGLKVVEEGLKKKVLEVGEEGAVIFPGEKYDLHTRVFRNKLGLPTYEAKDLGLAKSKWERWEYDKSYIVTANEIDEYFKVLLKTLSLLYPDLAKRTTHLSHGVMKLTSGKMSSRTGKVITGEGLLNELKEVVIVKMGERDVKNKEVVADQVAVASLKYSVLKQAVGGDIVYEPEKMTNMEGDTGPYLQYTYARARSVLAKAKGESIELQGKKPCNPEEISILRWLYRYPELVSEAGEKFAPHLIAGYVYELAARFNTFYNQHQIVGNDQRLVLTRAVANVLKSGLGLLGIQAPEEM